MLTSTAAATVSTCKQMMILMDRIKHNWNLRLVFDLRIFFFFFVNLLSSGVDPMLDLTLYVPKLKGLPRLSCTPRFPLALQMRQTPLQPNISNTV